LYSRIVLLVLYVCVVTLCPAYSEEGSTCSSALALFRMIWTRKICVQTQIVYTKLEWIYSVYISSFELLAVFTCSFNHEPFRSSFHRSSLASRAHCQSCKDRVPMYTEYAKYSRHLWIYTEYAVLAGLPVNFRSCFRSLLPFVLPFLFQCLDIISLKSG
jgi:hypothetical protein